MEARDGYGRISLAHEKGCLDMSGVFQVFNQRTDLPQAASDGSISARSAHGSDDSRISMSRLK